MEHRIHAQSGLDHEQTAFFGLWPGADVYPPRRSPGSRGAPVPHPQYPPAERTAVWDRDNAGFRFPARVALSLLFSIVYGVPG
jgi:hypothetical protein